MQIPASPPNIVEQMNFVDSLKECAQENGSLVCVGLDSDIEKIPHFLKTDAKDKKEAICKFNKAIIDETYDLVCAYKLNIAFYELLGPAGYEALKQTRDYIPPKIPAIVDAKRGDIGNTSRAYARALLDFYNFDGITVNPYLGYDSLQPFLNYQNKGILILCRTSNPGSADFQDLTCGHKPLYQIVAQKIAGWNQSGNVGAIVGATYPHELKEVREIVGEDMPILIPGVGKQKGDLEAAVKNGTNSANEMAIVNSSRSIIFTSPDADFAPAARAAAKKLRNQINRYR